MTTQKSRLVELPPKSRNCFLIGAGFSNATAYRLPTSVGFLSRQFRANEPDDAGNPAELEISYGALLTSIDEMLSRLESRFGSLDRLNLEDVMTDLYVRSFGIGRAWETRRPRPEDRPFVQQIRFDYQLLLDFIRIRINSLSQQCDKCPLVKKLTEVYRGIDSIITLNYDTIIEDHFNSFDNSLAIRENMEIMECIGDPDQGRIRPSVIDARIRNHYVFAKLHGSVDWINCTNPACPRHQEITRLPDASNPAGLLYLEELRCRHCGHGVDPVIIPPIASKPFEQYSVINRMWHLAHQSLRLARRWVFLGVSFAPTDLHLQSMVRSASSFPFAVGATKQSPKEICIVNRSFTSADAVRKRLVSSLSRESQEAVRSGTIVFSLFDSVGGFLDAMYASRVGTE